MNPYLRARLIGGLIAIAMAILICVTIIVLASTYLPTPSAHADSPLPPGYRPNELVAPGYSGQSWCVGPGQRLLVLGSPGNSFAVVIDQSNQSPDHYDDNAQRWFWQNGC